jgi:hypothetical protein
MALAAAAMLASACAFPDLEYDAGADGGEDAAPGHDATTAEGGADATGDSPAGDAVGGDATTADATTADSGDGGADAGADADAAGDGPASADAADASDAADAPSAVDGGADGGGTDAGGDAEDGATEGAPPDAGGDAADAAPDVVVVCDEDLDTYHAEGGCGGNDCCDIDKQVHPGQTKFFTDASACGSFDYDCNGKADPQYPTSITCGGTGALGCTGGPGYMSDPGCGNSGTYYQCVPNGALACKPGSPVTQVQGCN